MSTAPRRKAPPGTSAVAARRVAPFASAQRERIFAAIQAAGPRGMTDAETEALLGVRTSTLTPRRGELVSAGRIIDSAARRPTPSGAPATVWIVVAEHDELPLWTIQRVTP